MTVEPHIKAKPGFFRLIPWISNRTANALYPFIFLPREIYQNLQSENPDIKHVALLIHEQTHYNRQQKIGIVKFGVQYLFSPTFRFNEELIAVQEAMRYLKRQGQVFDIDMKAKHLSSWLYLWPVSKTYAREQLQRLWEEA